MAIAAFLAPEEWVATVVDHPVQQLRRTIVFPPERPCRLAVLDVGGRQPRLPIAHDAAGRTWVRVAVQVPLAHTAYTVRWLW